MNKNTIKHNNGILFFVFYLLIQSLLIQASCFSNSTNHPLTLTDTFETNAPAFVIPDDAINIFIANSGHILMKGKVNGMAVNMLLETGTQHLDFDSLFVFNNLDSLKMELVEISMPSNTGYGVVYSYYRIKNAVALELGKKISNAKGFLTVTNLKSLIDPEVDVIVPIARQLSDGIFEINLRNSYIRTNIERDALSDIVGEHTKYNIEGDYFSYYHIVDTLCLYRKNQIESINIYGKFLIDFGSPRAISLLPESISEGDLINLENFQNEYSSGSFADEKIKTFYIECDSLILKNMKIKLTNKQISVSAYSGNTDFKGFLGIDFFVDNHVIIDFNQKHLYLKPHEK
jgi:hypothetical protein